MFKFSLSPLKEKSSHKADESNRKTQHNTMLKSTSLTLWQSLCLESGPRRSNLCISEILAILVTVYWRSAFLLTTASHAHHIARTEGIKGYIPRLFPLKFAMWFRLFQGSEAMPEWEGRGRQNQCIPKLQWRLLLVSTTESPCVSMCKSTLYGCRAAVKSAIGFLQISELWVAATPVCWLLVCNSSCNGINLKPSDSVLTSVPDLLTIIMCLKYLQ